MTLELSDIDLNAIDRLITRAEVDRGQVTLPVHLARRLYDQATNHRHLAETVARQGREIIECQETVSALREAREPVTK